MPARLLDRGVGSCPGAGAVQRGQRALELDCVVACAGTRSSVSRACASRSAACPLVIARHQRVDAARGPRAAPPRAGRPARCSVARPARQLARAVAARRSARGRGARRRRCGRPSAPSMRAAGVEQAPARARARGSSSALSPRALRCAFDQLARARRQLRLSAALQLALGPADLLRRPAQRPPSGRRSARGR